MAHTFDELGTAILDALIAKGTAEFSTGRYCGGGSNSVEEYQTLQDNATEKAQAMWRLFYDMAAEFGPTDDPANQPPALPII